jgi:molybdopterin-guanine dinucleotide biosynthesis protein A
MIVRLRSAQPGRLPDHRICHHEALMITQVAAAILCGGRARRLGGLDKSRLAVQGHPIINRQLEVLQQLTPHVLVVSGQPERFADLGLRVVPDAVGGAGALGGIYTAIISSAADRVLTVGCDLPFLDAGLLALLAERAADRDGAWVCSPRGPEPLLACYRTIAASRIRARIDAGHLRASELGLVLDLAEVRDPELAQFGPTDRLLANINTPEDYERFR